LTKGYARAAKSSQNRLYRYHLAISNKLILEIWP